MAERSPDFRAAVAGAGRMIILRCSQKLLKRLRLPATLAEPAPQSNPLGEWAADIDSVDRQPFVLLLNAATGLVLVLPGNAQFLQRLHLCAAEQLAALLDACGRHGPLADAEVDSWRQPPTHARSRDRSLVSAMNQRRYEAWAQIAHNRLTAFEVALRLLQTPFTRKDLGRDYHFARDLLRQHLLPSAKVLSYPETNTRH